MNKNKVIYKAIFAFIQKGLMGGFTWRGFNTNVTKKDIPDPHIAEENV